MQADPATLFDDWAARVARGESPDPREYLDQAGPAREELAQLMEAYLQAAPRREPDPETVELARTWLRGDSPLADLRARQGIRREDVVAAIVDGFNLAPEKAGIVRRYYHRLESGLLDPSRLSRPLLDLLGNTLGVANETILGWRTRSLEARTGVPHPRRHRRRRSGSAGRSEPGARRPRNQTALSFWALTGTMQSCLDLSPTNVPTSSGAVTSISSAAPSSLCLWSRSPKTSSASKSNRWSST